MIVGDAAVKIGENLQLIGWVKMAFYSSRMRGYSPRKISTK
jgi:hypothetical protein